MEFSDSNIKKFLKFFYISGNAYPKKRLIYQELELLSPSLKNKRNPL